MIQLVVNTNMLREIDERRLIHSYARLLYNDESDIENDIKIRENLIKLLDWDINGSKGLETYCSKFESIKEKDWIILISFIKDNRYEIKNISSRFVKKRKLESKKIINSYLEEKEYNRIKRFSDENYTVSGRGKKAKPCIYKGREYKSRQECMYKEGLTKAQLYKYLKENGEN